MPQQFPILNFEQSNPLLTGMQSGSQLYKQLRMMPLEIQQAHIANALNEQKKQQQAMYLQKYPELLAAELSKAQLEPDEMKARTGLMGGQLRELEQKMKYNPQLWSAETQERKAKAEDLTRRNQLIQSLLGGSLQEQGYNVPHRTFGQTPMSQNIMNSNFTEQKTPGGMSYAQASLLSDQLGLPKPEIIDVDGRKIAISAFGNIPIAEGLSPLQKELTKEDAKKIGNLENNVFSGTIKEETLNELSSVVSNPAFQEMRKIPIAGKYELAGYARFGTPEQKELVGNYLTLTGQIIKDSARDFAGQFRIGEQALLNSMKPNPGDTVEVATGKIEALSLMNKLLTERSRITSGLMRDQGLSLPQAMKEADKLINSSEIKRDIKQRLEPKYEEKQIIGGKTYIKKNGKVYEL